MRYRLLAFAGVAAIACAAANPALAADCRCRDAVRAALAHQAPTAKAPMAKASVAAKVRKAMRRMAVRIPAAGYAQSDYDYRSASAVDSYPYTHHWTVAPQGYVPPPPAPIYDLPAPPPYDGPQNDLSGPPLYDVPPPPGAPPAYGEGYQDGYAYGYQAGITVDQGGWIGGVGYERHGGGGGGGGGGGVLTLAQPDSLNGPNYNSYGESYGGDYQSANQVDAWRQKALTPPSNAGSGSK